MNNFFDNSAFEKGSFRRIHQRCSIEILQKQVFFKFSQNSQENTCARVSFLEQLQALGNFVKKETLAQVFSYEFCEIFKNTFLQKTASVLSSNTRPVKRSIFWRKSLKQQTSQGILLKRNTSKKKKKKKNQLNFTLLESNPVKTNLFERSLIDENLFKNHMFETVNLRVVYTKNNLENGSAENHKLSNFCLLKTLYLMFIFVLQSALFHPKTKESLSGKVCVIQSFA